MRLLPFLLLQNTNKGPRFYWIFRLGNLRPHHAPEILDAVVNQWFLWQKQVRPDTDAADVDAMVPLPPFIADRTLWRGRMGMTKEEQLQLIKEYEEKP